MVAPQSIANPAGAFGLPLTGTNVNGSVVMSNDAIYIEMVNNSAAARSYGDVVVTDVTGLLANTSTTQHDNTVIGVVAQQGNPASIPVGSTMIVQIKGVTRVNIAANTVAALAPLEQSAVAGVAQVNATAITVANAQATFAVALESQAAKDTGNTIRCKLV